MHAFEPAGHGSPAAAHFAKRSAFSIRTPLTIGRARRPMMRRFKLIAAYTGLLIGKWIKESFLLE